MKSLIDNCSEIRETDSAPILSVIIPVRDDPERLERCLSSLLRDRCPAIAMEIIVGDNGCSDGCEKVAALAGAKVVKLIGMNVASVRNGAAKYARGDFLAFVDADHTVEPGWMKSAIDTFCMPDIGAVGAPYQAPRHGSWVQRSYDRFRQHPRGIQQVEWLGSGNLIIRRDVFQKLGGFDSRLETCEDVDLCGRIRLSGCRIVANPAIASIHWGDPESLAAIYRGELWRGRSNLRVSLRKPYSLRNLSSALIPLVNAASVFFAIGATIIVPRFWQFWIVTPAVFLISSVVLRLGRMQGGFERGSLMHNLSVAAVFEISRSLALLMRSSHRRRSRQAK